MPQLFRFVGELAGIGKDGLVAKRGIGELVFVAREVGRHEFQMFQQVADDGGRIRPVHDSGVHLES